MHCGNSSARNKACNVWRIAITFETQQNQLFYNSFFLTELRFIARWIWSYDIGGVNVNRISHCQRYHFLVTMKPIFDIFFNQNHKWYEKFNSSRGILDDKRVEVFDGVLKPALLGLELPTSRTEWHYPSLFSSGVKSYTVVCFG